MSLEGFKSFNFNEGVPSVSVTANGITFNKAVTLKLGQPEFAVLLINEETQQIAVKCANQDDENAVAFYKEKAKAVFSVRWSGKDLLNTIESMMGWDLKKNSYRIDGQHLKEDSAILFDFKEAKALS